ncbi:hypothetical protein JCM19274_151 [Algibacter lectus]|uniref:Uncharacterized protein n=1 Tax=Algibacter lectus TaxID=221126 RepID=A0A090WYE4_9FLAO|nr:hypothetical protein JCM19274_151 [Algibacter lectus]
MFLKSTLNNPSESAPNQIKSYSGSLYTYLTRDRLLSLKKGLLFKDSIFLTSLFFPIVIL